MTHPSKPRRRMNRFVAFVLLCIFTPIFVFGATAVATVAATGTVQVRIDERGEDGANLWIPVPAILFDIALFAAPRMVPPEELQEAREQIAPYLPALRQLADALEALPNATLVEVESPTEHVRISKRFGTFHVEVHDQDADVSVQIPARLFGSALGIFG